MELHRGCKVLLLGAVLSSAACLGQAALAQPELAAPVAAIESGSAAMDTSYCSAISTSDPQLSLVSKFCEFALTYRQQLPDFIAQQTTTARQGLSENIITAQVSFRQGQEHYSHLTINDRPAEGSLGIISTLPKNIHFSSTGEFGSLLVDLFASPAAAEFKFREEAILRGVPVAVYEFHLPSAKNTFWTVRGTNGQILKPEFRGQLWLEQRTGRPLREELEPVNLPASSGVASLKTVTDYTMTSVGDVGAFLLPVSSESTICTWDSDRLLPDWAMAAYSPDQCATNVLFFHDYRKFAATARILDASPEP